jgi:hypothetical protein
LSCPSLGLFLHVCFSRTSCISLHFPAYVISPGTSCTTHLRSKRSISAPPVLCTSMNFLPSVFPSTTDTLTRVYSMPYS